MSHRMVLDSRWTCVIVRSPGFGPSHGVHGGAFRVPLLLFVVSRFVVYSTTYLSLSLSSLSLSLLSNTLYTITPVEAPMSKELF